MPWLVLNRWRPPGRAVAPNIHTIRSTMTVPTTASDSTTSEPDVAGRQRLEDGPQLEADQQEREPGQQEDDQLPDLALLEPGGGGQRPRPVAAEVETGGHHGQHARGVELVGGQVGGERQDQQHRVLDDRRLDPAQQAGAGPSDGEPDAHAGTTTAKRNRAATSVTVNEVATDATATW